MSLQGGWAYDWLWCRDCPCRNLLASIAILRMLRFRKGKEDAWGASRIERTSQQCDTDMTQPSTGFD